jgi:Regulator of chromosome condensation (RCC1) repeat
MRAILPELAGLSLSAKVAVMPNSHAGRSLRGLAFCGVHVVPARAVVACTALVVGCAALAACSGSAGRGVTGSGTAGSRSSAARPTPPGVYRFGVVGNRGKIAKLELSRPALVAGIRGQVVQISTSNSDGYALTADGTVWAWGVASYGELGDGALSPYSTRAVRVEFPAGVRIVKLPDPMPFDGALAIDSRGDAWGWGLNADGDLCLPGLLNPRPARIPLTGVTIATGARAHALFYSHGRVYACGSGEDGVLGDGSTASTSTPVRVSGLPANVSVTDLTSSWNGSGALLGNGTYYDWGYNPDGQLGDGKTASTDLPVRVRLPDTVRQVFQGGSGPGNGQTIALLADGSVWTWGDNQRGQLGDGSTTSSDVPVRVRVPAGVRIMTINSGGYACYAIDSSGRLWAWGGNQNGQLGTGSGAALQTRPVEVGIHLTQISSTASNVAGLAAGG